MLADGQSELTVEFAEGEKWRLLKQKKVIEGKLSGRPLVMPPTSIGGGTG
jgi:hypothetical protein